MTRQLLAALRGYKTRFAAEWHGKLEAETMNDVLVPNQPPACDPGAHPHNDNSALVPRQMTGDAAKRCYDALRPFLRLLEPWGYYLPPKVARGRALTSPHPDWPLAWRHSTRPPAPVTWNPKAQGKPLTFAQFLMAYRIEVIDV
jgi:hypothetical protein